MNRLPLLRVAEVAFLTPKSEECAEFYRKIGLEEFPSNPDLNTIHFANVGEQYFGFAAEERGFFSGYEEERIKVPLHIAFEIPLEKIDDCIGYLTSKGIKCSPKIENTAGWHGAKRAYSTYFLDPQGNIMELWAPER